MSDWITTTEAVALSGYHIERLRELAREGKIKSQKWGIQWQISKSSLEKYLKEVERLGAKRGPKSGH